MATAGESALLAQVLAGVNAVGGQVTDLGSKVNDIAVAVGRLETRMTAIGDTALDHEGRIRQNTDDIADAIATAKEAKRVADELAKAVAENTNDRQSSHSAVRNYLVYPAVLIVVSVITSSLTALWIHH